MNPILEAARTLGSTPAVAMNLLQDLGQVSDLCVTPDDVAPVDRPRAARWLTERPS